MHKITNPAAWSGGFAGAGRVGGRRQTLEEMDRKEETASEELRSVEKELPSLDKEKPYATEPLANFLRRQLRIKLRFQLQVFSWEGSNKN